MADAPNTPSFTTPQVGQSRSRLFKWVLNGNSTGAPIRAGDLPDKTVQALGTWGGGALAWEGTNDPDALAGWGTLTDTTETALSQTADSAPQQVLQNPVWLRPKSSGGTDTVINALLNAGKSN